MVDALVVPIGRIISDDGIYIRVLTDSAVTYLHGRYHLWKTIIDK